MDLSSLEGPDFTGKELNYALAHAAIVAVTDSAGTIIYANELFCKITKYSLEELLGKTHRVVKSGFHPKEFFESMWATIASGRVWKGEICNKAKDGTIYWVDSTIIPILGEDSLPVKYVSIRYDISKRKLYEFQLKQAHQELESRVEERTRELARAVVERESEICRRIEIESELIQARREAEQASTIKSRFLANMGHEIRTPLTSILGYTSFMLKECIPYERARQILKIIERNGRHLKVIIDDILDISKVEAGKIEIEAIETSLPQLFTDLASTYGREPREKGLVFKLVNQGDLPENVKIDQTRLHQILCNLLKNALKFTSKGRIELAVHAQAGDDGTGDLRVTVSDTGIGISPEQRPKLFRRFGQADISTTRLYGGTGLGLALSKELAKLMGGELVLLDAQEGVGSAFRLVVPFQVVDRPASELGSGPDLDARSMAALKGKKVLIVEDCPDIRFLVEHFLMELGISTATAEDGLAGMQKALAGGYNLVLMDIQMPRMDGIQAVRRLREQGYDRPVLAFTAHAQKEEREAILAAGFNGHLMKPIDPAALSERLAHFLAPDREAPEHELGASL